jgi:hypothetical protein
MRMNPPAEDNARREVEAREKLSKTYQEMWARAQEASKKYFDK